MSELIHFVVYDFCPQGIRGDNRKIRRKKQEVGQNSWLYKHIARCITRKGVGVVGVSDGVTVQYLDKTGQLVVFSFKLKDLHEDEADS